MKKLLLLALIAGCGTGTTDIPPDMKVTSAQGDFDMYLRHIELEVKELNEFIRLAPALAETDDIDAMELFGKEMSKKTNAIVDLCGEYYGKMAVDHGKKWSSKFKKGIFEAIDEIDAKPMA